MRKTNRSALASAALLVALVTGQALAITIPTVPVGNVGNAGKPSNGGTIGAVDYNYRIGTYEVTNSQYVEFLNAKAASDPFDLYNSGMGSDARGGITQSGVSPNFSYAAKTNMADKPVNYVSWYDSIRFANWLNNGQGTGDTETGAYTLLGGTPTPSNGPSITRNAGATWVLPNENEWFKAGYHQPAAQGGDVDDYWLYPTRSNTAPTMATAQFDGYISNPGVNVANYNLGADWNGQNGNVTTVGSAGPSSASFYGTSDQGGNVFELNENLYLGVNRGLQGGAWDAPLFTTTFLAGLNNGPTPGGPVVGFRLASVPEPSTAVLAGVAFGLVWMLRKRFE